MVLEALSLKSIYMGQEAGNSGEGRNAEPSWKALGLGEILPGGGRPRGGVDSGRAALRAEGSDVSLGASSYGNTIMLSAVCGVLRRPGATGINHTSQHWSAANWSPAPAAPDQGMPALLCARLWNLLLCQMWEPRAPWSS